MIQFGGSDQWGNIVSGIELVKKEKLSGLRTYFSIDNNFFWEKNGKNSRWCCMVIGRKYSVKDFWQFWRNTSDDDVINFLKLFTEIEISEIEKFKNLKGADLNKIKILLANEVHHYAMEKRNLRK